MSNFNCSYQNCQKIFGKYNFLYFFLLLNVLSGCKKFVTIEPPQTQLIDEKVFADNATAHSALTVIYSKMIEENGIPYNLALCTGLSSDELTNYSNFPPLVSFYSNSLTPQNGLIGSYFWNPAYSYIYQANAVITGLKNSKSTSPAVNKQLTGEALFIRAFWHFYLVNLFGDIPVITSTDYSVNRLAPRIPKVDVYKQIILDLKNAKELLNSNFVDVNDTSITTERVRPTKAAASALLAKAYLYANDYLNAEIESSNVISNVALFNLAQDINSVFLKNSHEAIWQIQPVRTDKNTPEGANFILKTSPQTNVHNCTTVSMQLLNAFEPGDNRKVNWIANYNGYYFPYKYKANGSVTGTVEYSTVFRLAEQYLIRAEARAQLQETNAISDLNIIRNRAGLGNYSGATDKSSLLMAIYHERQVELFTEWGNRWFDIKRTTNADHLMSVITPLKGGIWNSNAQLYPIPQSERDNDPNLNQNPGY